MNNVQTLQGKTGVGEYLLSIVVPAFNEAEGIEGFLTALDRVAKGLGCVVEYIVVDDGSTDETFENICRFSRNTQNVRALQFTRNFGKEAALHAGLSRACGDLVITIDADGQHPPELMAEMLRHWRDGVKIVHAVKSHDSWTSHWHRWRASWFNTLLSKLGNINLVASSDFKLLDRQVVDVLVAQLPEQGRFYRGLTQWTGYPSKSVSFTVNPRETGHSKFSFFRLIKIAGVAVVSFTSAPLRLISILGVITMLFGAAVGAEALWSWLKGESVSGFVTIIISLLLIGSFIMISLGIIGEYIAKIYQEIKQRPVYVVNSVVGFETTNHTFDSKEPIVSEVDEQNSTA